MKLLPGIGLVASSARTIGTPTLQRPRTLADLATILRSEADPVFIAGGTDLCSAFNEGLAPATLVSLDRVDVLRRVVHDGEHLRIGSGVTHHAGSADALVRAHLPGFAQAWARIANVRVRGWATIGGNLMARRTRYEMSILLSALGARLHLVEPGGGTADIEPGALWDRAMAPGTLLHHVAIPLRDTPHLDYDRGLRPRLTLAFCRRGAGARAVLATEWLRPVMLELAPSETAEMALAALPDSFADATATNWYLRRVGTVLLRRALERAA